MQLSGVGDAVVHAEPDVERAQCLARDLIDLRVEEGGERRVHGETRRVTLGEIHARGEHGDGLLATLLYRHRLQLVMDCHVLRGVDGELQSHVLQGLRHFHATDEIDDTPVARRGPYGRLRRLGGCERQPRVHRVAGELDVRALRDGEGLQRNDRQFIFHLTRVDGIPSAEDDAVGGVVLHAHRTASHDVDVVRLRGVEIAVYMCPLVDVQ